MTAGKSGTLSKPSFPWLKSERICKRGSLGSYQFFHFAVKTAETKATRSLVCTRGATTQNSCCSTPFAVRQQGRPGLHPRPPHSAVSVHSINNLLFAAVAQSFPERLETQLSVNPEKSGGVGSRARERSPGNPEAAPVARQGVTGATRDAGEDRTNHSACGRAREAAASLSPLAALATPPAPLQAPRRPRLLRHPELCVTTRAQTLEPELGTFRAARPPRVPSRARRGERGVGARAPAPTSAAVTPSSPRAPRTPTQPPPLTVDVPESQLIAQLCEGLHGLQTAQLAALIHRPAWRRVPREVQLRETRRRYRRHRP